MKTWHAIVAILAVPFLAAQTGPNDYQGPPQMSGYTMANPLPALTMPFRRLHSAPIRLTALSPTPKTFSISRPAGATTYRIVVPCDVDVRLLGTMSPTDAVTPETGVLYLARTEATMGTSRPNYISAMTVGTPTTDCTPEMHYGVGGG